MTNGKNQASHNIEMSARKTQARHADITDLPRSVMIAAEAGLPWWQLIHIFEYLRLLPHG